MNKTECAIIPSSRELELAFGTIGCLTEEILDASGKQNNPRLIKKDVPFSNRAVGRVLPRVLEIEFDDDAHWFGFGIGPRFHLPRGYPSSVEGEFIFPSRTEGEEARTVRLGITNVGEAIVDDQPIGCCPCGPGDTEWSPTLALYDKHTELARRSLGVCSMVLAGATILGECQLPYDGEGNDYLQRDLASLYEDLGGGEVRPRHLWAVEQVKREILPSSD